MKTLKELFKDSILNPENIVIKNKKGTNTKYTLSSQMAIVAGIEIMVIDIKNCTTNINIANVIIRKEEIDNYLIPTQNILYQCNKDANKVTKKLTILEKLHKIEEVKIIYNIHYCRAGVGFVFYYHEKVNPRNTLRMKIPKGKEIDLKYPINWKDGLSVETYYDTFEEAVIAEYEKIKEKA